MGATKHAFILAAATMAAPTLPAEAATVQVDFLIEITSGTAPTGGSAVGRRFDGRLTYDDADLTPGASFIRTPDVGGLTMNFGFFDGSSITEGDVGQFPSLPEAGFSADGKLSSLYFFWDIPNTFFFASDGLAFTYDYTGSGARGAGVLREGVAPVPLPAAGSLLLVALAGGAAAALRRRPGRA